MVKLTLFNSFSCLTVAVIIGLASSPAFTVVQPQIPNAESKISVTSRCISSMKAYRQAIAFMDRRLSRSPAAVTFNLAGGDSITLHNRTHMIMRLEQRVLIDGMLARERACTLALMG